MVGHSWLLSSPSPGLHSLQGEKLSCGSQEAARTKRALTLPVFMLENDSLLNCHYVSYRCCPHAGELMAIIWTAAPSHLTLVDDFFHERNTTETLYPTPSVVGELMCSKSDSVNWADYYVLFSVLSQHLVTKVQHPSLHFFFFPSAEATVSSTYILSQKVYMEQSTYTMKEVVIYIAIN